MRGSRERFEGSEADLCDWLIEREARHGWTAYPETGEWDVLLVRPDGFQVGIEAKLRPCLAVLEQAASRMDRRKRPDQAVVLVGAITWEFKQVATRLHLGVYAWSRYSSSDLPDYPDRGHRDRIELPPFVPVLRGGQPSPTPLTRWKLAALRLCLKLRAQGYVTAKDVTDLGMSLSRWTQPQAHGPWLVADGRDPGSPRRTRYIAGGGSQLPDQIYPELAAQVAAHYGSTGEVAA